MEKKRAVVFSGGGAKGGYQIGVWKALLELDYHPDIVVGTSVGALNGALMAMGRYDQAYDIWSNMGMNRVFQQFTDDTQGKDKPATASSAMARLVRECVFDRGGDYTPLQQLVKGLMDEECLRGSDIVYGLVTTRLSGSLQAQQMFVEEIPYGEAADYILASAACFPFMKTYTIGGKKFVDGGYSDNIPLEMALEKGAEELVVVNIGGATARQRKAPACDAQIHYIHSRNGFAAHGPASAVMFDGERSLQHIRQGYLDTMKVFGRLEGYAYTFQNGEITGAHALAMDCSHLFERVFSGLPNSTRLEKLGQKKVLEILNSFVEKPFLYNSSVLVCLECAADLLEMDFTKVYSLHKLQQTLLGQLSRHTQIRSQEETGRIRDLLSRKLGEDNVRAVVSAMDAQDGMCYAASLLTEPHLSPSQKKQLWMLAALLPKCFCGAIFLAASAGKERGNGDLADL